MSVSLALIPIALTMRLVMGKQNFNNWVESVQVKESTTFTDELELVRTVRKAGYDAEKWSGSIKTHIDGENLFFFWEHIGGKWVAVFGKSDSKQLINQFIDNINKTAGRPIFETSLHTTTNITNDPIAVVQAPSFPTNFRDGELLFRTLKEFGINPVRQGANITCKVEQSLLTFHQTGDNPFQVEIHNAPDLKKMFQYLSDVDEDYKRCVQSMVYEKLKQRAELKNMTIENEEVLEDNSIVVTLNIGG
ncbi:hypothetical protein J2T12_004386 [Paenibacillus anaericanus]|uniref:hypothetical protein n=1 Tax=Paenibacillus anaericanus TaxID=170367 RepID=UPI002784FF2F|nr:hypothetical protein [Paenibacillus anaericanus]MDQ0090960.1 hypothetical protein [Paenibacillus anaericanus]